MDSLLYIVGRLLVALIQALPLRGAAVMGRAGGWLAWHLDRRHRRVALRNLELCFGNTKSLEERYDIARENFCRIGEAYVCGVKTAGMTFEELRPHLRIVNVEVLRKPPGQSVNRHVVAVGHFGNFEVYARFCEDEPDAVCATTYRGLRQPGLDRALSHVRAHAKSCLYFERRRDARALREAMANPNITLGLLADQHAGDGGAILPFFGVNCSSSTAPAVLALRYHCSLHTAVCFRLAPGQWEFVVGDEIPLRTADGHPRSTADITLEINRTFEAAIRRDPANWFWVHNRWKTTLGRDLKKPLPSLT